MINRLFNLQYFTDYMNATTSAATYNDLSDEMKTFYDKNLIRLAEPYLVHDQFGQKRPIPRNGGKTIEFRGWTKLPTLTSSLTEGTIPDGQALDAYAKTATVAQYGGFVKVTDVLQLTAIDPVITEASELIGQQAGRTMDNVTKAVINAGTQVVYSDADGDANDARTDVAVTDVLTVKDIRKAVRLLEMNDAPKINGYYVGIVSPAEKYDLMNDTNWVGMHEYTDKGVEAMYANEIGMIAGVRFVETTNAQVWASAGASSCDIYSTLILGQGAYGVTEVEGGGLQTIIKTNEQAGGPLNQYATVGWKGLKTAKILVDEYMVRIESGCSYT